MKLFSYLLLVLFLSLNLLYSVELKDTHITVYKDNISVVNQIYEDKFKKDSDLNVNLNLPKTVIPESVNLNLPEFLILNYQKFKYINSGLLDKEVKVLAKDGTVYKGTIILLDDDKVLVKTEDNENKLIFKDYINIIDYGKTENLTKAEFNSLTLNLNSTKSYKGKITLNYIMNGLSWNAYYDAVVNEDETQFDLNSYINISNNTNYDFKNVKFSVVAGMINNRENVPVERFTMMKAKTLDFAAESPEIKAKDFSEHYIYEIPSYVSELSKNSNVKLLMFSNKDIKFSKVYVYKGQKDNWYFYDNLSNYRYNEYLDVEYTFKNSKENNLNKSLPEGKIRVYRKNGEFLTLIGEDDINYTPAGEELKIKIAKAFNVKGERKIIKHDRITNKLYRDTILIKIKNRKKEDIKVKIKEYLWGKWNILKTTHKYEKVDANNIEFNLNVPANKDITVEYTAEYNF